MPDGALMMFFSILFLLWFFENNGKNHLDEEGGAASSYCLVGCRQRFSFYFLIEAKIMSEEIILIARH